MSLCNFTLFKYLLSLFVSRLRLVKTGASVKLWDSWVAFSMLLEVNATAYTRYVHSL